MVSIARMGIKSAKLVGWDKGTMSGLIEWEKALNEVTYEWRRSLLLIYISRSGLVGRNFCHMYETKRPREQKPRERSLLFRSAVSADLAWEENDHVLYWTAHR